MRTSRLACLTLVPTLQGAPIPPQVPSIHAASEALLQKAVTEEGFQGVVLVAKGDQILHHRAYGLRDREGQLPNLLDTPFLVGSLTKSFTAVTVMQLVEAGKLDLHRPLGTYLPGLRADLGAKLTLHLLLRQQSGLSPHLERLTTFKEKAVTSADILAVINTSKLAFEPGTRFEYSNLNFHLAALVVEAVTGKAFGKVLEEQTFGPLKLTGSGVERHGAMAPRRAKGYRVEEGKLGPAENNISYALGSGEVYATAADLHRWGRALLGDRLLRAASRKALWEGALADRGNYAYGFYVQPYRRGEDAMGTVVRHGGTMDGFTSNFHLYLEDDLNVIVLANLRPLKIRDLTYQLKEAALGRPPAPRQAGEE